MTIASYNDAAHGWLRRHSRGWLVPSLGRPYRTAIHRRLSERVREVAVIVRNSGVRGGKSNSKRPAGDLELEGGLTGDPATEVGRMDEQARSGTGVTVLIVDDEWDSATVRTVRKRIEEEGWGTHVVQPEDAGWLVGDEFESQALYEIDELRPDGVLLDVRFGEHADDRFKGLGILRKIVERHPKLPVLMFTQYAQGPDRETAVRGTLDWDAPVDFIDKLASPEEVVLRLRRLFGRTPERFSVGESISIDSSAKLVYADVGDGPRPVHDILGMKFEILSELAEAWYRSPGELVPFSRLERYSEGEDARASLRVRIREIKDSLGAALGVKLGAGDLIINVRDQGYRLIPPRS